MDPILSSGNDGDALSPHLLGFIHLDRDGEQPLYLQLIFGLRQAITDRRLEGGVRLPSSRDLASALDVSRNTVKNSYEQLVAEGYLEARVGAGTFVSPQLPAFVAHHPPPSRPVPPSGPRTISRLGQALAPFGASALSMPGRRQVGSIFTPGLPALEAFPWKAWKRLTARSFRHLPADSFGYFSPVSGYLPLRQAIATYLKATRGLRCQPEQIVITPGSQMASYIAAHVVLNPGDAVWVENPGYGGVRGSLRYREARLVPVPVDEEGLDVAAGIKSEPDARLAVVTPSHQYPLGHTMSLTRRLQLLEWAAQNGAWILEDDYDSEYRYDGPPLGALQGLDSHERVIYAGTFSKVMFPALRLGYLVLPPDLVHAAVGMLLPMGQLTSILNQSVLADFINEGHFARHIRRMRRLYQQRRDVLLQEIEARLGDRVVIGPADCGMHLALQFPASISQMKVQGQLANEDRWAVPLAGGFHEPGSMEGIILSFSNAPPEQIREDVALLADAIRYAQD